MGMPDCHTQSGIFIFTQSDPFLLKLLKTKGIASAEQNYCLKKCRTSDTILPLARNMTGTQQTKIYIVKHKQIKLNTWHN